MFSNKHKKLLFFFLEQILEISINILTKDGKSPSNKKSASFKVIFTILTETIVFRELIHFSKKQY